MTLVTSDPPAHRVADLDGLDVAIINGRVIDGTGAPWFWADVGIQGDRIVYVGRAARLRAARVVDATGQMVCPGFIDVHTHSDLVPLAERSHLPKVMQGVTTDVIGQDGLSYAPVTEQTAAHFRSNLASLNGNPEGLDWQWRTVAEYLSRFDGRVGTNIAMLAPHGNIRAVVMGLDSRRPTAIELKRMQAVTAQAMEDGAVGLSTALTYAPCSYADADELAALCEVVGHYGGYFAPHMRNYGPQMEGAVEEVIDVCTRANLPLHLTHFHASFASGKGKAEAYLQRIDRARHEGLEVTLDMYPYLAGSTFLAGLLPGWVHDRGSEGAIDRLRDPATRGRIQHEMEVTGSDGMQNLPIDWPMLVIAGVASSENAPLVGLNLIEAASRTGKEPFDCFADLLIEERLDVSCLMFFGHEDNVQTMMRHPAFMVGSDGLLVGARPHPRGWGTFPRYLARYVRELGVLTLEECIRKMTSASARRVGLEDRGLVKRGLKADLAVFNPETVQDTATYENPRSFPRGIPYVIVNGVLVKDADRPTGATPGRALKRRATVNQPTAETRS
jgi:N-acyl-D-amino-acid deacylase